MDVYACKFSSFIHLYIFLIIRKYSLFCWLLVICYRIPDLFSLHLDLELIFVNHTVNRCSFFQQKKPLSTVQYRYNSLPFITRLRIDSLYWLQNNWHHLTDIIQLASWLQIDQYHWTITIIVVLTEARLVSLADLFFYYLFEL